MVELAMVILIMGLLLALALPSFLEIRRNAQNRLAQNSLHTSEVEMNILWSDQHTYSISVATISEAEPGLRFTLGTLGGVATSSGPTNVLYWGSANSFAAVAKSASGRCYLVTDVDGLRKEAYWRLSGAGCTLPTSHSAPGVEWTRIR